MDRNSFWKAALIIGIGLSLTAFVLGMSLKKIIIEYYFKIKLFVFLRMD
jgi:putative Mn2+ efflux pump MntP